MLVFGVIVVVEIVCDVIFVGYVIVDCEVVYFLFYFDDFVDVFVVDVYWYWNCFLCLVVLFLDMDVGVVDCCVVDFD